MRNKKTPTDNGRGLQGQGVQRNNTLTLTQALVNRPGTRKLATGPVVLGDLHRGKAAAKHHQVRVKFTRSALQRQSFGGVIFTEGGVP